MFRSLWSYIYVYYIRYFTDLKNRANIAILTEDLKLKFSNIPECPAKIRLTNMIFNKLCRSNPIIFFESSAKILRIRESCEISNFVD